MLLVPRRLQPRAMRRAQGGWMINPYRFKNDPYWTLVVHLCHFNEYYGGSPSLTTKNETTRGNYGSVTSTSASISTVNKRFGAASLRRNVAIVGAPGWTTAAHADYQFGTADWTIEFWYRTDNVAAANANIFDGRNGGAAGRTPVIYTYTNGRIGYYTNSAERIVSGAGVITSNTWYAIAVARASGITRMFVNGTQVGSNYTDTNNYNSACRLAFGSDSNGNPNNTNWDELRVTNGLGRYASSYTVATEAFPNN